MVAQFFYDFASAVQHAVSGSNPQQVNKWEKAVLRQMGATSYRLADPRYDASLIEMTRDVYRAFKTPDSNRIIIYEQKYPNAAYLRMSNTMLISTSLLEALNDRELRAVLSHENARYVKQVIGHEIGHRMQRNFLTAFAAVFTIGSIALTSYLTTKFKKPISKFLENKVAPKFGEGTIWQRGAQSLSTAVYSSPWAVALSFSAIGSFVGWVLGFPGAAIQRKLELDADKKAAETLRDPEALATALIKIGQYAHRAHGKQIAPTDMIAREYNVLPEPPAPQAAPSNLQKTLAEAQASHPSIEKRIKILHEMAERQRQEAGVQRVH